ncbi:diphthamide synthesis protein, partial [Candidatus Woesearchaeota archaeon]|nr:diphthamide synthesis protein [Candidatus Woesearchaeota archaeon]
LYIGSGKFHPIAVALETDKPVFCLNPENGEFSWDVRKDADRIKKQNRVKIIRFLHAKNIGILISTKPGQFNTVWVDELKRKYPEKIFYTFLFDTLQPGYLEDFPFIDFFVATACPRIQEDHKKVIDFKEIRSMDLGV